MSQTEMSGRLKKAYGRVVGLTGIMGSGKTTVAELLAALGAELISADQLAREIFSPAYGGFAGLQKSIDLAFGRQAREQGAELFDQEGRLDRSLLGRIAFASEENTRKLNQITHPHIAELFCQRVEGIAADRLIVYDVPLLFENNLHFLVKSTIVVEADVDLAVARACQRSGLAEAQVRERLKRQISIEKKLEMADYVIRNNGSLDQLRDGVRQLWYKLVKTQQN